MLHPLLAQAAHAAAVEGILSGRASALLAQAAHAAAVEGILSGRASALLALQSKEPVRAGRFDCTSFRSARLIWLAASNAPRAWK